MKKTLYIIDIVLGIALLFVLAVHFGGCSAEQIQSTQTQITDPQSTFNQAVDIAQPVLTTAVATATGLGAPAWVILILNVLSSTAAAIVATRKKTVITE